MTPTATFDVPADTRFRRHGHGRAHLVAVLGGGMSESLAKGAVYLAPGDLRLSPPARHDLDFGPRGARCLVVEVDADGLRPVSRSLFLRGNAHLARLAGAVAAAQGARDPAGGLAAEALVIELLAAVERCRDGRSTAPPPWLRRVRELLHDTPSPPPVNDLAAAVGVHRVSLARAFRDHVGTTVTAYARGLRLERAVRAILTTDTPLAAVAADTGFADQAHLTRTLRARLGTTPAGLRRARRLPPFKTDRAASW